MKVSGMILPLNKTDITLSFGSLVNQGGHSMCWLCNKMVNTRKLKYFKGDHKKKMLANWVQ